MKYTIIFGCTALLLMSCANNAETVTEKDPHANHGASYAAERYIDSLNKGLITVDSLKGSPRRVTMIQQGSQHIHLEYSSPGTKNRVIWGGLVPFDQVWVAGAHNATTISFSEPVSIQNHTIPAGRYAFFCIPGKSGWTVVLNKNTEQHLADDYNQQEDIARIDVLPDTSTQMTQRLTYTLKKEGNGKAVLQFAWERLSFEVVIQDQPDKK